MGHGAARGLTRTAAVFAGWVPQCRACARPLPRRHGGRRPRARGPGGAGPHAWQEAFDRSPWPDREGHLSAEDLEAFALAAFFTAQADLEVEIRQRAFAAYEAAGDTLRAAFVAVYISRLYFYAGKPSIASAWARRAEHLVGPDGDTYVHGYIALGAQRGARSTGDLDAALAFAEQAVQIGGRNADADLKAYALSNLGSSEVSPTGRRRTASP